MEDDPIKCNYMRNKGPPVVIVNTTSDENTTTTATTTTTTVTPVGTSMNTSWEEISEYMPQDIMMAKLDSADQKIADVLKEVRKRWSIIKFMRMSTINSHRGHSVSISAVLSFVSPQIQ